MKLRNIALIAGGFVAGILLAPKKGSENRAILKEKTNEIYLQAKELDIDTIKDRVEEIKIEVTKLDYETSKEFVSKQAAFIKEKLVALIDELQKNKKIQPTLSDMIDKTENVINETIDYIDEHDLINKAKENVTKASSIAKENVSKVQAKAKDIPEDASEVIEKVKNKVKKD